MRHLWIGIVSLALISSARAFAHCPSEGDPGWAPDMYSVAKEFARSRFVVRVRSLSETWLDEDGKPTWATPPFHTGAEHPLGMDPYLGAIYELEVLETFKGRPPTKLKLFSSNSTARVPLPVNGEYLLFIQQHPGPGVDEAGLKIFVDNCGNSVAMPFAASTLREVRSLAVRKK